MANGPKPTIVSRQNARLRVVTRFGTVGNESSRRNCKTFFFRVSVISFCCTGLLLTFSSASPNFQRNFVFPFRYLDVCIIRASANIPSKIRNTQGGYTNTGRDPSWAAESGCVIQYSTVQGYLLLSLQRT